MVLTTDFDGTSLPSGWTFEDRSGGGASVAVSGGRARITLPAAVSDGISDGTGSDGTAGIVHAIATPDLDIAVQLDSDISVRDGRQFNIHVRGSGGTPGDGRAAQQMMRYAVYQGSPSRFLFTRNAGGNAVAQNAGWNPPYFSGHPSWLRVVYTHSSGIWIWYAAKDGVDWVPLTFAVRSVTLSSIKLSMGDTASVGGTIRIGQVVDIGLAGGAADLRAPAPTRERVTVSTILGTAGVLPAGWLNDSANNGAVSWTGQAMRLTIDGTLQSRARVRWTAPHFYSEGGLLLRFATGGGTHGNTWFAPGIGNQDTSGLTDQYIHTPAYGSEINSTGATRQWLRRDLRSAVGTPNDMDSAYTFLHTTTEVSLAPSGTVVRWLRVEKIGRRVRMREWADGAAEPSTWQYDGQDEIVDGPYAPSLGVSHNDQDSPTASGFDIFSAEFYALVAPADPESLTLDALPDGLTLDALPDSFTLDALED